MKRKYLVLFALILVLLTAFVFRVNYGRFSGVDAKPKTKTERVEVRFAGNKPHTVQVQIDARVECTHIVNVAFAVGGKLEQGEFLLQRGDEFHKGQLLYQVNNREAFAALNKQKAQLSTLVLQTLPQIEAGFPSEKNKWVRFMEELKPQFLLPELPKFSSSKERYLITDKGILSAFYDLQLAEVNMTNYFYLAPFDGTVLSVKEQPGNVVSAGSAVAQIGTEGPFRITAAVPDDAPDAFGPGKTIVLSLRGGKQIGKAAFRHRAKTGTSGPTVYTFDLIPDRPLHLFHGMPVKLSAFQKNAVKSCKVPASALDGDLIQVLKDGKLQTRRIGVIGKEKDEAFVSGIEDGEAYAVNYHFSVDPSMKYYPE